MVTRFTAAAAVSSFLLGAGALQASSSSTPANTFVVGQVTVTDPRIVDLTGDYTLTQDDRTLQLSVTQDARGSLTTSATLLIQGNGQTNVVGPFSLDGKLQASGNSGLRVQLGGKGLDDDQDDDGIQDDDDADDDNDGVNDDVDTDDDHSGSHHSGSATAVKSHGSDDGVGDDNGGTSGGGGSDDTTSETEPGDDHGGLDNGSDDPAGDDDHDGLDNSHDSDDDNDGLDDSVDSDDDDDGIDDNFEHHRGSGRSEAFRLRGAFVGGAFQVQVDIKGFGGNRSFTANLVPQNTNHTLTVADAHSTQNGSSYTGTRTVTTPSGSFNSPALQQNRASAVRFAIKSGSFGMDLRGSSSDNTSFSASSLKMKLGYGNVTIDPSNVTVTGSAL
jgi:hypothetical protein